MQGASLSQILQTTYFSDVIAQITQMPDKDCRISALHNLLSLIKTEGQSAIKSICDRYAPNYKFSISSDRFIVLNSELLAVEL